MPRSDDTKFSSEDRKTFLDAAKARISSINKAKLEEEKSRERAFR